MSSFLPPHWLQHVRFPCPSLFSRDCSDSCPLSQWWYLTISPSAAPFSVCFQSFPASGYFPMSWLFTLGGQSVAASFTNSPSIEYSWLISFRIDWFDVFAAQGTLRSLLQHHNSKASILRHSASFIVQLSHQYMTTGKTIALSIQTFTCTYIRINFPLPGKRNTNQAESTLCLHSQTQIKLP